MAVGVFYGRRDIESGMDRRRLSMRSCVAAVEMGMGGASIRFLVLLFVFVLFLFY